MLFVDINDFRVNLENISFIARNSLEENTFTIHFKHGKSLTLPEEDLEEFYHVMNITIEQDRAIKIRTALLANADNPQNHFDYDESLMTPIGMTKAVDFVTNGTCSY